MLERTSNSEFERAADEAERSLDCDGGAQPTQTHLSELAERLKSILEAEVLDFSVEIENGTPCTVKMSGIELGPGMVGAFLGHLGSTASLQPDWRVTVDRDPTDQEKWVVSFLNKSDVTEDQLLALELKDQLGEPGDRYSEIQVAEGAVTVREVVGSGFELGAALAQLSSELDLSSRGWEVELGNEISGSGNSQLAFTRQGS